MPICQERAMSRSKIMLFTRHAIMQRRSYVPGGLNLFIRKPSLRHSAWLLFCAALATASLVMQGEEPRQGWAATWISHPTAPLREPLVLHFRKSIELSAAPQHYIVHVSGDRRFLFYVNGQRIGAGPAASDLPHWRYGTFDLAPALHGGANLLTATVWNFGIYSAISQMSDRTAFLVQGDTAQEAAADTNASWSVAEEPGIEVVPRANDGRDDYMAASPGEALDAAALARRRPSNLVDCGRIVVLWRRLSAPGCDQRAGLTLPRRRATLSVTSSRWSKAAAAATRGQRWLESWPAGPIG